MQAMGMVNDHAPGCITRPPWRAQQRLQRPV
jgi:3-methyladenine DNA glycosylase Tag